MPAQVARSGRFRLGLQRPRSRPRLGRAVPRFGAAKRLLARVGAQRPLLGSPANLSAITYYFTTGTAEAANALSAGEVDFATVQAEPGIYKQLQAASGLSVRAVASNLYEDLDMNEASGPLSNPLLRRAIMMSLDRDSMATQLLSPYGLPATPVENRVFLPGNPGYTDNGANYDQPDSSRSHPSVDGGRLFAVGATLERPGGQPVDLTLTVSAADPIAQQLAEQVVTSCAGVGITVNIDQTGSPGGDVLGAGTQTSLPAGWQLAIELRHVPAFPSEITSRYVTGGAANQDGFSNATMNALASEVPSATPATLPGLYQAVDTMAWKDYVEPTAGPAARGGGGELEVAQPRRGPIFRRHCVERGELGLPGLLIQSARAPARPAALSPAGPGPHRRSLRQHVAPAHGAIPAGAWPSPTLAPPACSPRPRRYPRRGLALTDARSAGV